MRHKKRPKITGHMDKRTVMSRIWLLVGGFVLAAFLAGALRIYKAKEMDVQFQALQASELPADHFELALWKAAEVANGEYRDLLIRWWYNQNDNKYYFFLPREMADTGIRWIYSCADSIWIDDESVDNGAKFALEEGEHQVKALSAGAESSYQMEIRFSSSVATLFLDTESGNLEFLHTAKENFEKGSYVLFSENGQLAHSGEIEKINCRGNATWEETPKKSYQMKLQDSTDLFGMGKDSHWLLLANAFDYTLMRNMIAFDIAKNLDLSYTPDSVCVDVYANGEFQGNYLLTEKVEIGTNRVNIYDLEEQMEQMNPDKLLSDFEFFMVDQGHLYSTKGYRVANEPEDISGGYLLELELSDRYGLEASGFMTSRMQPIVFKSPQYASFDQVSYIANRYQDFEDALFAEDGYSPYTGVYYGDYIDMESFARKYLLEELAKNLDASYTSQYIYKPADSVSEKFYAGPAWDYDKAIAGNGITNEGIDLHDPYGLYAAVKKRDYDLWYGLNQHEDFRALVKEVFRNELVDIVGEITDTKIRECQEQLLDSAMCNIIRWQLFWDEETPEKKADRYRYEVEEVRTFLEKRMLFLEQEWNLPASVEYGNME